MMSLVSYGASSDEDDSENESEISEKSTNIAAPTSITEDNEDSKEENHSVTPSTSTDSKLSNKSTIIPTASSGFTLNLPAPTIVSFIETIVENDDEFLRKKAVQTQLPPPPPSRKIIAKKRETVRITIPAMSEYEDDKVKGKPLVTVPTMPQDKSCGLLGLLPKPKIDMFPMGNKKISTTSMVPHSVARKQSSVPSISTPSTSKNSDKSAIKSLPINTPQKNDSDNDSDDEDEDFFSLNADEKLPEANLEKINELVANKMASISNAMKHKLLNESTNDDEQPSTDMSEDTNDQISAASKMDQKTMEALCGSSAKRSRNYEDVNIIDLSGDQVLPNRDEWLRQQLTSKTEYQSKGLVDEEPGAGTRKKHQITYLAHQARANEHELQAMWAANRHARRLTQNKYGF